MTTPLQCGLVAYGLDRPMSGIGRYTLQLAQALGRLDGQVQVTWLSAGERSMESRPAGARRGKLPGCGRLPGLVGLGSMLLPAVARRLALDVVHDPTGVAPLLFGAGGARTVVTIHDVFAWSCPGNSTLLDTFIYRRWLPRVLPRVDSIITVSQASKGDIIQYLRVPGEKITVIHEGVNAMYQPMPRAETRRTLERIGLPLGYILFVGSVEKRKNVRGLLQAYALLRQRGEQRPLVVAGLRRSNASDLPRLVEQLGLEQHVLFTGYIPDADLPALYSSAELFVFPSLYEGFGLPPLEAMACGTPVVCSNAGSLPEVVGDAALMVDPHDAEGLADAMGRVLADQDLRQQLREKGLARPKMFTWEKTARETLAVYRKVLGLCQELLR